MPFLSFEIKSSMTQEQLNENLQSAVSEAFVSILSRDTTPFLGKVTENGFRITRTTFGRNSFKPVIYGRFLESIQGSSIKVIMTFHPLVWIFILAWPIFFGAQNLDQFSISKFSEIDLLDLFVTFAPIIVGAPIFFIEASKSKKLLEQILGLKNG